MSTFRDLIEPAPRLRRSVIDDVTGNPVVTSTPTGDLVQRSSILPVGRDDDGNLVPAVPQAVFNAISHPARRQMLDLLLVSQRSVNAIAEHFQMSRPAVSQT